MEEMDLREAVDLEPVGIKLPSLVQSCTAHSAIERQRLD